MSYLQRELKIDIEASEGGRFADAGVTSLQATALVRALGAELNRSLPSTLLWECPTVDALCRFLADEGQAERGELAAAAEEPIAIVGMACRFPGASGPEGFWKLLSEGRDAVREVPTGRYPEAAFDADPSAPGKSHVRRGAFLEQVDGFDPQFFDISPREAVQLDPQQRLALELTWEALADAGRPPASLRGSRTGVFLGVIWRDYAELRRGDLTGVTAHTGTGQAPGMAANRISYVLGVHGPSMVVDTACSSSLVAVHLACQSLRSGESSMALAGGVNLLLSADTWVSLAKFGGLSPEGRCSAFDARANGYVRGEGGGMVVLKRLSTALADGDPIYAVIPASAVNNDGDSNGLTAPNPRAQKAVLREAYARARIDPRSVQYVEAHGTGTSLGDPIEARALGEVLGQGRETPLRVGSVKTNIGHLEGAAGIAGLCKAALALRHGALPPSLNFQTPNPEIPFDELGVRVQTALEPWPVAEGPARAGVSAFGWGGTNCHVVLEAAPTATPRVPLAAGDVAALQRSARTAFEQMRSAALDAPLDALVRTATAAHGKGGERAVVKAGSRSALEQALEALAQGAPSAAVSTASVTRPPRVAWVFSPQGGQWQGMGRELFLSEPVFREAFLECDRALIAAGHPSVLPHLEADAEDPRALVAERIQPLLFAHQVALGRYFRSLGIEPVAVVGHSMGEIAAAVFAGALTLAEAARIIHHYSRLQSLTAGDTGMAVLDAPADAVNELLVRTEADSLVWVSGFNGPRSTVISGQAGALGRVLAAAEAQGVLCSRIQVDVAAHTRHMDAILPELQATLEGLRPQRPSLMFASSLLGEVREDVRLDAAYWARNLREPVRFAQALEALVARGVDTFLELHPQPVLNHALRQFASAERPLRVLATSRRGQSARDTVLETLAELHLAGLDVRWPGTGEGTHKPELVVLSGRSEEALADAARRLHGFVSASRPSLADVAYSSGAHHDHYGYRAAVAASSGEALLKGLEAVAERKTAPGVVQGRARADRSPRSVFIFPGQGSQWVGMGRELLRDEPVFREALERCDRALSAFVDWSLLEVLSADASASRLAEIDVLQPVLFSVEVALSELWKSWGIVPGLVIGHSMGEVAAAYVAGALSLHDAARVIATRSKLLRRMSGKGAMALVELPMDEARATIGRHQDRVSVAVSNGKRSTVLAGDKAALEELVGELQGRGVFCRFVKVDVASHSPQMDPLLEELRAALQGLAPRALSVPMFSTVTGQPLTGLEMGPDYWVRNLREPVLFGRAVEDALAQGPAAFIEQSPHPILLPAIEDALRNPGAEHSTAVPSLRREEAERATLLASLGTLYTRGVLPAFRRVASNGHFVRLPTYPFQRKSYMVEATGRRGDDHPLLGRHLRSALAPESQSFQLEVGSPVMPYLADHGVADLRIVPGATYSVLALSAVRAALGDAPYRLEDIAFRNPLFFKEGDKRVMEIALTTKDGETSLTIYSRPAGPDTGNSPFTMHVTARVVPGAAQPTVPDSIEAITARCPTTYPGAIHYERAEAVDIYLGPSLHGMEKVWYRKGEALVRIRPTTAVLEERVPFGLHPIHVDLTYMLLLLEAGLSDARHHGAFVPGLLGSVQIFRTPPRNASLWAYVRSRSDADRDEDGYEGDVWLLDDEGQVVLEAKRLRFQRLRREARATVAEVPTFGIAWRKAEAPASAASLPGPVLVLTGKNGAGESLAAALEKRGVPCIVAATPGASTRPDALTFDPRRAEDFARVVATANGCRAVVHMLALDESAEGPRTEAPDAATASALHLVQTLTKSSKAEAPRLWFITRGVQPAGGAQVTSPGQGTVWGFARSVSHEYPELRATCVDLPPVPAASEVDALVAELLAAPSSGHDEEQLALRADGRYVARLVRVTPTPSRAVPVQAEATYLLTGGLGGLGLAFARWLVEQGARSLVLLGRKAPGPDAEQTLRELAERGASIRVESVDVGDASAVEELVKHKLKGLPPLRGIIHAAGVLDDGTIPHQSEARLRTVLRPKVEGAWNLHRATSGLTLDFFVLCSSAASLLGTPGQANYSAANAFLDSLAYARRSAGLPALSVNWGAWSEVGLAAQEGRAERLGLRGVGSMTNREGVEALSRLLRGDETQVGVMGFNLRQWEQFYPRAGSGPLYAELRTADKGRAVAPVGSRIRETLEAVTGRARHEQLEDYVRGQVAQVLRLTPERVEGDVPLVNLGLDSLMTLELRNRLEAGLGLTLPATILWAYPSLKVLVPHLAERMGLSLEDAAPAAVPEVVSAAPEAPAEAADDDELIRLLQAVGAMPDADLRAED
ncbi:SDR family NAD(P)-dependent oxidoreductase [Archangium gephyra]|uniref:SDR family NAD(P)-dependent oxidoreductase n=1 Tax=Archangium gephyra TaxID=48 RepID=UPI0035D508B4